MSLQEFDIIIDRMERAFDYAMNLGQPIDAIKVLYSMNSQLPDSMQLDMEDIESESMIKQFISEYKPQLKSLILEYRQRLMNS